jgi:hypothetical protein
MYFFPLKTYKPYAFGTYEEYFDYLHDPITNSVRCTVGMKSRIALAVRLSTGRRPFSPSDWTYISRRN